MTNTSSKIHNAEYDVHNYKVFIYNNGGKNWEMASTLFHEYFHGIQMRWNGGELFLQISEISGDNPILNFSRGRYLMEAQAYYFQYLMGNNTSYYRYQEQMDNYYKRL